MRFHGVVLSKKKKHRDNLTFTFTVSSEKTGMKNILWLLRTQGVSY